MPTTPDCPAELDDPRRLFQSLRRFAVYLCPDGEHEWEGEPPVPESPDTPKRGGEITGA